MCSTKYFGITLRNGRDLVKLNDCKLTRQSDASDAIEKISNADRGTVQSFESEQKIHGCLV